MFVIENTVCLFLLTQPELSATFANRTTTALGMVALLFVLAWLHRQITARLADRQRYFPAVLSREQTLKNVA
jgi:hypothetical protein